MTSAVAMKVKGVVMTSSPGPQVQGHQGDQEGIGTRGDGDAVSDANPGRQPFFQFGDLGTHDVAPMLQDGLDASLDIGLDALVLGLEIDEIHDGASD
jgi:hypothetical protein